MCGRFTLTSLPETIAECFTIEGNLVLTPRYNIAPSQKILIVRQRENQPREFAFLHWGLIPSWMKEENQHAGWINARVESVQDKPAFRKAIKYQRCLIVADGFYEWKKLSHGKQPYYIHRKDNKPFAMAGIWDYWQDGKGNSIESCAILTKQADEFLKPIHDRIPVILKQIYFAKWLDPANHEITDLVELCKHNKTSAMQIYPISTLVNKPSVDSPDCIAPLKESS